MAISATVPCLKCDRYPGGGLRLIWEQATEDSDQTSCIHILAAQKQIMALLVAGIQFISDLPSGYEGGKVPMFNLQVWTEPTSQGQGTYLRHMFIENDVTSPLVFQSRGACSVKQKVIILAEETKRRMYNQDRTHRPRKRMKGMTKTPGE